MGARVLIGVYLLNCVVSALVTAFYHRQIGFRAVQQRGRNANNNGNAAFFLSTVFATVAPQYPVIAGKTMARSFFFYYIPVFYGILFFTKHISSTSYKYSRNDNETHYSAVILGLVVGTLLRRKFRK